MSDGEICLHQSLNHMERMCGVYGDIPTVAAILKHEAAALDAEMKRRTT